MLKNLRVLLWLSPALLLGGCNWLSYPMYAVAAIAPEKQIPAEFDKLPKKTVAVVVYSGPQTQLDYQTAQMEISDAVSGELRRRVDGVKVVDAGQVIRYQMENSNWDSLPPEQLCKTFKADYVLYISLIDFGTREAGSAQLARGHITAQCALYAPPAAPTSQPTTMIASANDPVWKKDAISAVFPKDVAVGVPVSSDWHIRVQTEKLFAQTLVQFFYKHEEATK